jgi:hypothetical protein
MAASCGHVGLLVLAHLAIALFQVLDLTLFVFGKI